MKPEPEETKQLICQCRKAVELKITVYNPADHSTEFNVYVNGPGLLGESKFSIQAKSTRSYELLFSPLLSGRYKGSIRFISEYTGEFWYKLLLVATPPDDISLEEFESEIG